LAELSLHDRRALDVLRARHGGSIRTDAFMGFALYDPELGYYSTHVRGIGRTGDFSTSATLSPALGRAIAGWIKGRRPRDSARWHVIEVGAGNGDLAAAVLEGIGFLGRSGLQYHIVETSPVLRKAQANRLASRRVRWHPDVKSALEAARGRALLISNELVDVFPCRVFRKCADGWLEQWISIDGDAPEIIWHPCQDLPASTAFEQDFPEGQVVETHASFRDWMAQWTDAWHQGAMLTIDYGARIDSLYHRRPHGSLRGYFFHQMVEGLELFTRIGRQDLTADVNFSDLEEWGRELGCGQARLRTQSEFIQTFHPGAQRQSRKDPALAFLTDAYGAGGAFKVLEQTRLRRAQGA